MMDQDAGAAKGKSEGRARALEALIECVEGNPMRHIYFICKTPAVEAPLPEEGRIAYILHDARRYIPLIDRMAYGLGIYARRLEPWEIARYGLVSAPADGQDRA